MAIGQRYTAILDAACEVFARRGYHGATIREIARAARLSLAGLYHYVGGKEELLFLVLDRALATMLRGLDQALAGARTPESRLLALVYAHLEFGFTHAPELRVINRYWDVLAEPRRSEIAAKRRAYIERGRRVLAALDPHHRSGDELYSATNLLLGMLNGIAAGPFVRSAADARELAAQVGGLFLYGFLERFAETPGAAMAIGRHA
ncbi:MAG TPA: TetR/AcrR family transcriptional regulator [Methylomirabilota bacterium]